MIRNWLFRRSSLITGPFGGRSLATLNVARSNDGSGKPESSGPTSTNQGELDKFRKLASKWWTGEDFLALRNLNQLRVPFIVDSFNFRFDGNDPPAGTGQSSLPLENVRLLDIGCGGGILAEPLARLGADVIAIDPVREAIRVAELHARSVFVSAAGKDGEPRPPKYRYCTIEEFGAESENHSAFDGVIASEVLEHVDDIGRFLHTAIGCIRPGGFLFVTTINQTLWSYFGAIFMAENILGLLPKGTHDYSKLIPPAALSLILNDYNCDVVKVHGMFLNPMSMQWSWTQDQSINYAMVAVKTT